MPNPDPIHMTIAEKILSYIAVILAGGGVGAGGLKVVQRRKNGKADGTSLTDVVNAIHKSGEDTRKAIYETSEKNRDELEKTREVIRQAHDKQMAICNSQVLRAEMGLKALEALDKK